MGKTAAALPAAGGAEKLRCASDVVRRSILAPKAIGEGDDATGGRRRREEEEDFIKILLSPYKKFPLAIAVAPSASVLLLLLLSSAFPLLCKVQAAPSLRISAFTEAAAEVINCLVNGLVTDHVRLGPGPVH